MALAPNTLLQNRYLIVNKIGHGGMGAVYEAIDQRLRSTVAIKQMLPSEEATESVSAQRAFEREAQLLAGLRHPALPKVIDHFVDERGQFLVMEYIPGDDLGLMLRLRRAPFLLDDVLQWGNQLLLALDYLHRRQPPVLHRDIKPQNLKLTGEGEIVLLDFGLAKGSSAVQSRVTSTGSIFGYTPQYAPLEQIQGTGTDPRSDLYALAATLYHLMTNVAPIDALSRATAVLSGKPDPLFPAREFNPQLPAAISDLLAQAMALNPNERPDSAAAMRALLTSAAAPASPTPEVVRVRAPAGEPAVPQPPGRPARIGTAPARDDLAGLRPQVPPRRVAAQPTPWVWPAIGVLALVLVAAVFLLVSRAQSDPRGAAAVLPSPAALAPTNALRATSAPTALPTAAAPTVAPLAGASTSLPTDAPTAAPASAPTVVPTLAAVATAPLAAAQPPPPGGQPPPGGPPPPPPGGPPPPRCAVALGSAFSAIVLANPPIQQRLACATQAEMSVEIAEQSFERGSMLWYGTPLEQIYVLVGSDSGTWQVFQQSALVGQPTPAPAEPPTGRVPPSSRFGLVWATQANVQSQLGWGLRPEDGPLSGALQTFAGGTTLLSPAGLGRGRTIYVLFVDGTFRRFDAPNE